MKRLNICISFALLLFIVTGVTAQRGADNILRYSMDTPWTSEVTPDNVWPEYPRPQMTRDNWINLNGLWEYAIADKNRPQPTRYQGNILVPFAVESSLSGVKKMVGEDNYLWYKRSLDIPSSHDGRWLLHFGAVDWEAVIYLNGTEVGMHRGGYDAFSFDITPYLKDGQQELVVRVWDPTDNGTQPRGKQVANPRGIWYTPVTGIWQTVWLEPVPNSYIEYIRPTPDLDAEVLNLRVDLSGSQQAQRLTVIARQGSVEVARTQATVGAGSRQVFLTLPVSNPRIWSPDDPFLYDLDIELSATSGQVVDAVSSYFGMRKISMGQDHNGHTYMLLNNEPVFHWGLLDQGWWPDGLYTPPTEEAMLFDIEKSLEMGFNVIRKHVKIESQRYYYHCDRMGVLVWQDMPNGNYFNDLRIQAWDPDADRPRESAIQFEAELKAMIDNFYHFPSIIMWVPFNEGWGQYDTERVNQWMMDYDPSRLSNATSGWADRGVGDVRDVHIYPGPGMAPTEKNRASVLGEFGGLGWPVEGHLWWDQRNWGYLTYYSKEEFQKTLYDLIDKTAPLMGWGLAGAIYTQTTDVEGEVNGLITYDRKFVKVDPASFKRHTEQLFKQWWKPSIILSDSELKPQKWKVSYAKHGDSWKDASFNDRAWDQVKAPLSTYDNFFLSEYTDWTGETIYLRRDFHVMDIPDRLYLKHYLPRSTIKVYINGQLVLEHEDRGGRKRDYSHELLHNALPYLKKGLNTIAVELNAQEEQSSFDIGIYTTKPVVE